ncbi:Lnt Apolipoprotein N-acyltransferase [Candidatus Nanopelagicaceae bacterium]
MGKWYLAPLAIAVHIYALNRSDKKALSILAFAAAFNAFLLHWTSIYVGSTPWVVLVVGLSILYLPLLLVKRWGIAAYPLLFVIAEEIRNRFPFGGFGWGRLAYSQADAPYAKIAYYGGAISLSSITALVGLALFQLGRQKLNLKPLIPLLLLLLPINVVSNIQTNVLMVQGNVPQYGLDFNSRATEVFFNHVKETDKALKENPNIDFILWPENAVDVDPFKNSNVNSELNKYKKPLIIGAIVDSNGKTFNNSILWSKNGYKSYSKQHLTPFGEYIPLRSLARNISPLVDQVDDFSAGNQFTIFTIGKAKVAPVICYELIDDSILEKAAKGSNILAVQTNSATFGRSAESAQQLSITRVRAIEHSRNIVSVSTTGYSAIINYKGEILQKTSMGTAEHISANVGLIQSDSPRDRLGDWAMIFTLIWLLLVSRRAYVLRR